VPTERLLRRAVNEAMIPARSELGRFAVLYTAMYASFGVASPFLPAFVSARGLPAAEIGIVLAAATAVRLVSSPLAGRIADLTAALRIVLAVCAAAAALATLAYLPAGGFWSFFAIALLQAAALGPIAVLADALALGAACEYGWVRGTGSAAFILGTLLSGQAIGVFGLDVVVMLQSFLLGAAALAALFVPEMEHPSPKARPNAGAVTTLLKLPAFRSLVLAAALILGSHAMQDGFAVIRWSAAGISATTSSLLWSESVAAEVVVFFFIGPWLVSRLTPAGAMALAAVAGIVRWSVMAQASEAAAIALVQPLHGITFALLHLACMRTIRDIVPAGLEGTAQALYGTVGIGAATAVLTLVSGTLYARAGAEGFWVMAALCALSLPVVWNLRPEHRQKRSRPRAAS
jgi:MFS transporter, PPP family, 3-phenylpropionic acid transporter